MSLRLVQLSPFHSISGVLSSFGQPNKTFDVVIKTQSYDAFIAVSDAKSLHLSEVDCDASVQAWSCDDEYVLALRIFPTFQSVCLGLTQPM